MGVTIETRQYSEQGTTKDFITSQKKLATTTTTTTMTNENVDDGIDDTNFVDCEVDLKDEASKQETDGRAGGDKTDSDNHNSIKCSAVHSLERDMPTFDYSHLVEELRARILEECEFNQGIYSGKDIEKCKTNNWHLARFLLRQKLDVDAAFEMLRKTMRFHHESLCNNIRPEDFPAEFYKIGGLFPYEVDRKGNRMLYIRAKVHKRLPEIQAILQAFLYYNIHHLDEVADGKGISMVIDCTGAGLANADLDMIMFMLSMLMNYFPKGLSYLLVHELPWVLKPFWLIARALIPEEHRQLIKFSNSRTIYEYIEQKNLPDFMGGTCERSYRAPPEDCTTLGQATKLWGIDPALAKAILVKFADNLPPDALEQALAELDEPIKSTEKNERWNWT